MCIICRKIEKRILKSNDNMIFGIDILLVYFIDFFIFFYNDFFVIRTLNNFNKKSSQKKFIFNELIILKIFSFSNPTWSSGKYVKHRYLK